jgi:hypothetical protein
MNYNKKKEGNIVEFDWFNASKGAPSVSIADYGMTFNKAAVDLIGIDVPRIMLG